jgi:hypothetical protein
MRMGEGRERSERSEARREDTEQLMCWLSAREGREVVGAYRGLAVARREVYVRGRFERNAPGAGVGGDSPGPP